MRCDTYNFIKTRYPTPGPQFKSRRIGGKK